MSTVLGGGGPGIGYKGSQARQALGLMGAPCSLQHVSAGHKGRPFPLFLTHVKAQLVAGAGCPVQELFVVPALWPPARFILTSWIGSLFISSRNSAWLKAYGGKTAETFPVVKLGSGS